MSNFLAHHWSYMGPIIGAGIYHVCGAAVSTVPPLPENAGFWKTWAYRIIQVFGANYDKAIKNGKGN